MFLYASSRKKQTDKCTFYNEAIEDIQHISQTCYKISNLWNRLSDVFMTK